MASTTLSNPIDDLESAFKEALTYFEGPGSKSKAKVGQWGSKETIAHFIFFYNKNIEGIERVSHGGKPAILLEPPFKDVDEANAATVSRHAGKSMPQVIAEVRQAHQRMLKAASAMNSLDVPIVIRPNGEAQTAGARIQLMANHWRNHLKELKAAS